jgi:cation transport ATPase
VARTGTLTYGRPKLTGEIYGKGFLRDRVLPLVAACERYSRHPLAEPIQAAVTGGGFALPEVEWIREEPGRGLVGRVGDVTVTVTGRARSTAQTALRAAPDTDLRCIVLLDGQFAASLRFSDVARRESRRFIGHLSPRHSFTRVLIVSGDREKEVRRLADAVAITEIYAETSPEEKLAIVRRETARARTVYIGDGVDDAPALLAATVGIAFGQHSDVTPEAARVVIVDSSLSKVDELMHLSYRLRRVALQSAIGGMALSAIGMGFAAAGLLGPVAGAVAQEAIDVSAVLNALRTARTPRSLTDYDAVEPQVPGLASREGDD